MPRDSGRCRDGAGPRARVPLFWICLYINQYSGEKEGCYMGGGYCSSYALWAMSRPDSNYPGYQMPLCRTSKLPRRASVWLRRIVNATEVITCLSSILS
jgi:hypothetical protein